VKTHFLVSYEPQNFSGELLALCGAKIANPEPVVMQETESRGLPEFQPIRDCAKCYRRVEQEAKFSGRVFVYGIVEAQEAKNAQAESAA
jgi:hypothetical protein